MPLSSRTTAGRAQRRLEHAARPDGGCLSSADRRPARGRYWECLQAQDTRWRVGLSRCRSGDARPRHRLHHHVVAYQADGQAFDREIVDAGVHDDGLELGVLRQQLDAVAGLAETLDGDFVADARHHDLTVLGFAGLLHREQVAVHDAHIAHAHALDLEQEIGLAREHAGLQHIGLVDVFLRQDRAAGGDAPDQRQRQLSKQRQRVLPAARRIQRAQGVGLQADAARGAAHQFDGALARQRLQMLFGRIGRLEAQFGGDFGARRRRAGALDRALHQVQNLLLTRREFGAVFHEWLLAPKSVAAQCAQAD